MNEGFEEYLNKSIKSFDNNLITEAMHYCLDGGKRFRPRIIFAILKGMGKNEEEAYAAAAALEYIQSYSLIHDDLPAMDNDDFRRGKPSCHKAFGEDIAILCGDALLNHSFGLIADSDYSSDIKVKLISDLVSYAGLNGMIKGQLLDIKADKDLSHDDLLLLQEHKTGGLFKYACLAPMHIAGKNNYEWFYDLGKKIGIVFQNQDDLFDIIKSEEELGKSISDIRNMKITALSYFDVDGLKEYIDGLFKDLDAYLLTADFDVSYLINVLNEMKVR